MVIIMARSNENKFHKIFKNKNKIAIKDFDQNISYSRLLQKINELIEYFKKKNLKKGDIILVLLPNSKEFIYCYLACMIGGFVICPVNPNNNKKEIKKIINLICPKIIIKNIKQIKFKKTKINYLKFYNENFIMGIFLSSGTTGFPKGICHNSSTILLNAEKFNEVNNIKKNIKFLHLFPMSYMAGFLNSIISPLLAGGTIILKGQFSIDLAMNFRKIVNNEKINYLWLNPTMINAIKRFEYKIKKFNHKILIFVATSALSLNDKIEFKKKYKINCLESYGMTEILIFSSETYNNKKIYSNVGKILPGCKIIKINKKLIVDSPFINKFYFNFKKKKIEENKNLKNFDTGDIGIIDKKLNLRIIGRNKNIIIKGGLNIVPEEIENKIMNLKNISECIAIGIKDKFYGENICLLVKTINDKLININKLDKFLKNNFSTHKQPKKIIQVNKLLKNNNDKIIRNNLLQSLKKNKKIKILYEKNY